MNVLLVIKLIDLAIAGGQFLVQAKAARDRLQEMNDRGGPTPEELDALDRETDSLLAQLANLATPPRPDA